MTRRAASRAELREEPIRCSALGTPVLWPTAFAEVDATGAAADPWPIFVVVGTDATDGAELLCGARGRV